MALVNLQQHAPKVVVTPQSNSILHIDSLEVGKVNLSIPHGRLKHCHAYLEYAPHTDFCDIQPLEDIPNIEPEETAEIYEKIAFKTIATIKQKDIVTCPCILQSQKIYAIDFSSLTAHDFTDHTCKDCPCCTLLSKCTNGLRYNISPLYQPLPKFKASAVFLYNLEFQLFMETTVKRILYDTRVPRTKSIIVNAVDAEDFKRAIPTAEIVRQRNVMTSGYRNGVVLEMCNKTLVAQAVREQKRVLRLWYGKEECEQEGYFRVAD